MLPGFISNPWKGTGKAPDEEYWKKRGRGDLPLEGLFRLKMEVEQ